MKPPGEKRDSPSQQGFTLMEVSLSVGIAAGWLLLALGLIGVLVDHVQRHQQRPVQEASSAELYSPQRGRLALPDSMDATEVEP